MSYINYSPSSFSGDGLELTATALLGLLQSKTYSGFYAGNIKQDDAQPKDNKLALYG